MLRISNKVEYAVRALVRLAMQEGLNTRELSYLEFVPENFLERIMSELKHAGIVSGKRGRKGGYRLSKKPSDITLGEIILALEGKNGIVKCMDNPNACDIVSICITRSFWKKIQKHLEETLYSLTLQDILDDIKNENLVGIS